MYEWVVFSVLFNLGNKREYVAVISEFHELYDVGWGWVLRGFDYHWEHLGHGECFVKV